MWVWGVVGMIYGLRFEWNFGLGDYLDFGDILFLLGWNGVVFYGINLVYVLGWNYLEMVSFYLLFYCVFLNIGYLVLDLLVEYCGCLFMVVVVVEFVGQVDVLCSGDVIDYGGYDVLLWFLMECLFVLFEMEVFDLVKEVF